MRERDRGGLQIHGDCAPAFSAVAEAFAGNFLDHGDVGASVAIWHEGALVVDLWGGFADGARTRPWERDTIVNVYSTTKGLIATAAHVLAERGRLDYDAPVARYWPEFAAAGKAEISVRQVLSHQAGLVAVDEPIAAREVYDWARLTAALAAQRPYWTPGTRHGYHAFTFGWLVGEVIQRISGQTPGRFFREAVAGPLALDAHIGLDPREHGRVAEMLRPLPVPIGTPPNPMARAFLDRAGKAFNIDNPPIRIGAVNSAEWRAAELPAANGHTNARALATLYGALCRDGAAAGGLLRRATVDAARTEQAAGPDEVLGVESRFGLGYILPASMSGFSVNPRAFGHAGMGGSLGFADPEAGLAFGYAMNQMQSRGGRLDARWAGLLQAAYAAVGLPAPATE